MELVLCRHAEAASNVGPVFDSRPPGASLTARGVAQARALAREISVEPVDHLVSSDLVRASATALEIGKLTGSSVTVFSELREWNAGKLEGKGDPASLAQYDVVYSRWASGHDRDTIGEGESAADVVIRFDAVVRTIANEGHSRAVIVSHGVAIRLWAAYVASNTSARSAVRELRNCGYLVIEGDPNRGWQLTAWSDGPTEVTQGLFPGDIGGA